MSPRTAFSLRQYSKLCCRATKRLFHPSTCMYPKALQQDTRILPKPYDSQKKNQNCVKLSPCLPKHFTFPGKFKKFAYSKIFNLLCFTVLLLKTAMPKDTPNIFEGQDAYLKDLKLQQPTCSKKCGGGDDLKKECEALAAKEKCAKSEKKEKKMVCEKGGGKSELEKKCHAFAMLKKCRKLNTKDNKDEKVKSKKEKDAKSKKISKKEKNENCEGSGKKDKETIEKEMCAKLAQEAICKKMAEQTKKAKKGKDSKSKEKSK